MARDPAYLGPAALAAHHRFLADIRDGASERRLEFVQGRRGVWGCDVVWSCARVCLRKVAPTRGILATRERLRSE